MARMPKRRATIATGTPPASRGTRQPGQTGMQNRMEPITSWLMT
jgi:hypothetical protein